MPALKNQEQDTSGTYLHIYNNAVENRNLFNDQTDFEVFLEYLKDYLTLPPHPDRIKKTFYVNGRTFQGIPHQPRNYFNKIDLIAYGLKKDSFHFLVNELNKGSTEKLVRSLCTRYAIYYNKKYQRKGSLFQGPYKSDRIRGAELIHITRQLHVECGNYSSHKYYLEEESASWIKPDDVFSYLNKIEDSHFTGVINGSNANASSRSVYQKFVEKYKPDEVEVVKNFIPAVNSIDKEKPILEPEKTEANKLKSYSPAPVSKIKTLSFATASLFIFVLLFTVGIRNVNTYNAQTKNTISLMPSPTPQVSGAEVTIPVKAVTLIKINDDSGSVNLRLNPSTQSAIVGKAQAGETFELISEEEGWYQIKSADGTPVFVTNELAQVVEKEDN